MAYSSVRVQFEIGHEASVRNKRTPEGFTHDWEVFVRGADNTDIQCFVEKVVFYLHETFPKPRRVIKEPPYSVKECGYAGFVLPIDVYLKNKEEPKKIKFTYDLHLQSTGPPISLVRREPRVFQNPSEDFRRNLIRGGGVGVDSPIDDTKVSPKKSTQSPKKSDETKAGPVKKHKPEIPISNSFAALFGTPIRRLTPEPKKNIELIAGKKTDIDKKKKESKPTAVKEDKDTSREKDKDRVKEKEKLKEKSEKSKRPPSPPVKTQKHESKEKDDREKKKEDIIKPEKDKKEKHKDKEVDREKSHKKDKKSKEPEVTKKPAPAPPIEKQGSPEKEISKEKPEKEKHKHRHKKKEKEKTRDKDKHKHKDRPEKDKNVDKKKHEEYNGKIEKSRKFSRSPSPIREKPRSRGPLGALFSELSDSASPLSDEEESMHSSSRSAIEPPHKALPETKVSPIPEKVKEPVVERKTKAERKEEDISPSKSKKDKSPRKRSSKSHGEPESKKPKYEPKERERSSSVEREKELKELELKRQREEQEKREKEEAERKAREREEELARKAKEREEELARKAREREEERKAKEREEELARKAKEREEELARKAKEKEEEMARKAREREEELSRKAREAEAAERQLKTKAAKKDKESKKRNKEKSVVIPADEEPPPPAPASQPAKSEESQKVELSKEYLAQLRDLQHRIMTLEDNSELQKVVKVIAESGQYEVTKKTFDFDLCTLDYATVKRLQEFFVSPS